MDIGATVTTFCSIGNSSHNYLKYLLKYVPQSLQCEHEQVNDSKSSYDIGIW